jgi:uncharacterized membrane protein YeiH
MPRALRIPWRVIRPDRLVIGLDLAGTFLFAAQGAALAIAAKLDLLGVAVVAFASALGGGMFRDVLIGETPPAALRDWRYAATALAAGVVVFCAYRELARAPANALLVLDAGGLALFSIAGARKALDYGLNPLASILMAGLTGSGGGVVRDVLLNRVPAVLRTDFYATAALAGAAIMIAGRRAGLSPGPAAALGVASCFSLRLAGATFGWHLPIMDR